MLNSVDLIGYVNILTKVVIDWMFICILFIIIFVISVILFLVRRKKFKKVLGKFLDKDYAYVIETNVKIHPEISVERHIVYFMQANSYLELGNLKNFGLWIDKIDHKDLLAYKFFIKYINFALTNDEKQRNISKSKYDECILANKKTTSMSDKVIYLLGKKIHLLKKIYSL